ncbi:MAG: EAL domain-containing protein [Nitrospirae bacterium]|nr:EAL domain-containing protein [Nitrospirota bacterium]
MKVPPKKESRHGPASRKTRADRSEAAGESVPKSGPDPPTGFSDLSLFLRNLRKDLKKGNPETGAALVLLELDSFRGANENLGKDAGDRILAEAEKRIASVLSGRELVGRTGENEFGLWLPVNREDVDRFTGTLRSCFERPFEAGHTVRHLKASTAVAIFPEDGDTADRLFQSARVGLHRSKETGSDALFVPDSTGIVETALLADLERALENEEISLVYQPRIDLQKGKISGVEVFAAWNHPSLGLLTHDRFLPAAEQSSLITPLTHRILHEALRTCRPELFPDGSGSVSVRLSSRILNHPELPEMIRDILRKTRTRPDRLALEIPERALSSESRRQASHLESLSRMGVSLTIGDFGIEKTSLWSLAHSPVNGIRLNESFIARLTTDTRDAALVRSLIGLAHNLGMSVVAEGVESEDAFARLGEYGCDYAQGGLISPPVSSGGPLEDRLHSGFSPPVLSRHHTPRPVEPDGPIPFDPHTVLKQMIRETSGLTGEAFFRATIRTLVHHFKADFVFIASRNPDDDEEVEVIASLRGNEEKSGWSFRVPGTPCELVYAGEEKTKDWSSLRTGSTVRVNQEVYRLFESARGTRFESFLGVPLFDDAQNQIGHIAIFFETPWAGLSHRHHVVELVELLSLKVQSELNRTRAEREREKTELRLKKTNRKLLLESITDPLTRLYNRRHFSRCMKDAFGSMEDGQPTLGLLLIDVDRFKSINDTFGHDAGDRVLQHVASLLKGNCRPDVDRVFRVGGEEFAILCGGKLEPKDLQRLGERINRAFCSASLPDIPDRPLTVSIGCALPKPQDSSWNALYTRADRALYLAKHSGRNRTVLDGHPPDRRSDILEEGNR